VALWQRTRGHQEALRRVIKTDPDPRVRQLAQAGLWVEHGPTRANVGRLLEMKPDRVRIWRCRYAAEGRAGLQDRSWRGRPASAAAAGAWSQGERLHAASGGPVVHALGPRERRPRHDLRRRQDAQAVAAKCVLEPLHHFCGTS